MQRTTARATASGEELPANAEAATPCSRVLSANMPVSEMKPGTTTELLTPLPRSSQRRLWVNKIKPPLAAEYGTLNGVELLPASEAMLTMWPVLRSSNAGKS